jgi:hypothetical protein
MYWAMEIKFLVFPTWRKGCFMLWLLQSWSDSFLYTFNIRMGWLCSHSSSHAEEKLPTISASHPVCKKPLHWPSYYVFISTEAISDKNLVMSAYTISELQLQHCCLWKTTSTCSVDNPTAFHNYSAIHKFDIKSAYTVLRNSINNRYRVWSEYVLFRSVFLPRWHQCITISLKCHITLE